MYVNLFSVVSYKLYRHIYVLEQIAFALQADLRRCYKSK